MRRKLLLSLLLLLHISFFDYLEAYVSSFPGWTRKSFVDKPSFLIQPQQIARTSRGRMALSSLKRDKVDKKKKEKKARPPPPPPPPKDKKEWKMMKYPARPLMTVEKLTKKEHHQTLFRQLNLQITNETRLAIVGSNVQAKNALFEILGGLDKSFEGSVQILSQNTSLGVLPDHPVIREERVIGCIDEGLKKGEKLIAQWNELSDKVFDNIKFPQEIKKLSEQLEVIDEKAYEDGVALLFFLRKEAAKELGLPPAETRVDGLTEEERRKVVLVRLLVENHDILVLKDPTAAVEAQGSAWLANYLRRKRNKAVVLLSEDRALLQAVCRQVIDVDHLSEGICAGGYSAWLERRLAEAQAAAEAEGTGLSPAQQRLAAEMAWLRADNQTRRLDVLRKFQALYPPAPAPALPANDSADEELAAALVRDTPEEVPRRLKSIGLKAEHVRQSYGRNRAIEKFSFSLPAGSVAALLGPSIGTAKRGMDTLVRLLERREAPKMGRLLLGEDAQFAVVADQPPLDPALTLLEAVCPGGAPVIFGPKKFSAEGFLECLGFQGDDLQRTIDQLSANEVRLVQLARLLNSPSNVIVADDPLRGLSLAQIRGLEEVLLAYDGVLLLRNCHDLVFLDRVASHVLSYEYRGREGDRLFLSEGGYFQARQAAKRRQKQFEKEWNEQQRRDSVYRSGHHLLDLPFKFKI